MGSEQGSEQRSYVWVRSNGCLAGYGYSFRLLPRRKGTFQTDGIIETNYLKLNLNFYDHNDGFPQDIINDVLN